MAEETAGKQNPFSLWNEWQQSLWNNWMDMAKKGMESGVAAGPGIAPGAAWGDWYQKWLKSVQEAWGITSPGDGLGATVYNRVMNAANVYTDIMNFWIKAMAPLAKLEPGVPLTEEKIKELYDGWVKDYQGVMDMLWGQFPSQDVQELAKSWKSATDAYAAYTWNFMSPVFRNMEAMPDMMKRAATGEGGAVAEAAGLFWKNYYDTVGKALRAPTLGYWREFTERQDKAVDAYIAFNSALAQYYALLYSTGSQTGEKIFKKLAEFKDKEMTPQTYREFYRIWWTINEEAYHDLFMSEEFAKLFQEVVTQGMHFKKWSDDLWDQYIKFTNLPSKSDMDEIYKAIYDLKKELRKQKRMIGDIEARSGKKAARAKPEA